MPDDDFFDRHVCKAAGIRLMSLIEHRVERFLYVYDFGERLEARHFIESFGDGEADVDYPAFVGGERRCPPEDVGGVPGFMQFLEAVADPLHEEHNEVVTWYGKLFSTRSTSTMGAAAALRAGCPPPGRIQTASRRTAAGFDLTCALRPFVHHR